MTRPKAEMIAAAGPVRTASGIVRAALSYAALSVVATWPLVASRGVLFGAGGDMYGWAWWLWAKTHGVLDHSTNAIIAAPFGQPIARLIRQPITEELALILARAFGEIAAINILCIVALALTATAAYAALERFTLDRGAAFVGGAAFGFCPSAVMQFRGGHAEYALNAFIPLFVLALWLNRRSRSAPSAALTALAYAGIALNSLYQAYFAAFFALFFVACDALASGRVPVRIFIRNYAVCAGFALALLLPFEWGAIAEQVRQSAGDLARSGHLRDYSDLFAFSARPWNYFVPSIDHPFVGRRLEAWIRAGWHGSNAFEQTLYVGIVPLALAFAGFLPPMRRRMASRSRALGAVLMVGALWMYLVSMPPQVAGVAMPSQFAYPFAPMFRAYARAGIWVAFLIGAAGALVLSHALARFSPARRVALLTLVLMLVMLDERSVSARFSFGLTDPPEVYRWLAREPRNKLVAEYPMIPFDDAAYYSYPYWQRIHGHPLVNGATRDQLQAWQFYEQVRDLDSSTAAGCLRWAGVEYILVHRALYGDGPIPRELKRYYGPDRAAIAFNGGTVPPIPPTLQLVRAMGNDLVFILDPSVEARCPGFPSPRTASSADSWHATAPM